jgi:hypothetical protein
MSNAGIAAMRRPPSSSDCSAPLVSKAVTDAVDQR